MANYIIEGTVSEVFLDEKDNISFKIFGTVGYSIKYEKEKYCNQEYGKSCNVQNN